MVWGLGRARLETEQGDAHADRDPRRHRRHIRCRPHRENAVFAMPGALECLRANTTRLEIGTCVPDYARPVSATGLRVVFGQPQRPRACGHAGGPVRVLPGAGGQGSATARQGDVESVTVDGRWLMRDAGC